MDLLVMENCFYDRPVWRIYDLKGSERNRFNEQAHSRPDDSLEVRREGAARCPTQPLHSSCSLAACPRHSQRNPTYARMERLDLRVPWLEATYPARSPRRTRTATPPGPTLTHV